MRTLHITGNVFLSLYLWITFCAFMLTVLNLHMYYPRFAVKYAYGMMAPYRSYDEMNAELLAEGETSAGDWEVIDLSPYYPVLFGEMSVRTHMAVFKGDGAYREQYARRLRELEAVRGRIYGAIRLTYKQWPNEAGSYFHNDLPYITEKIPLGVFR